MLHEEAFALIVDVRRTLDQATLHIDLHAFGTLSFPT
jgi:hypothetical protein